MTVVELNSLHASFVQHLQSWVEANPACHMTVETWSKHDSDNVALEATEEATDADCEKAQAVIDNWHTSLPEAAKEHVMRCNHLDNDDCIPYLDFSPLDCT